MDRTFPQVFVLFLRTVLAGAIVSGPLPVTAEPTADASGVIADATRPTYAPAVDALPRCTDEADCPLGVPRDYLATPSGWFHPSCIISVARDETYDSATSEIVDKRGMRRNPPECSHHRFDHYGVRVEGPDVVGGGGPPSFTVMPPSVNETDWLTRVGNNNPIYSGVGYLSARWVVPRAPKIGTTKTLYYFPALHAGGFILQPVLGWHQAKGDGTLDSVNGWSMAAWDCCDFSNPDRPRNILLDLPNPVKTGDTLFGEMVGSNCSATTKRCSTWTVTVRNNSTGDITSGTVTNFPVAFGPGVFEVEAGVLEVTATLDQCAQHSANTTLAFFEVLVRDINGNTLPPGQQLQWLAAGGSNSEAPPQCRATSNWVINNTTHTNANINWWPSNVHKPSAPTACGVLRADQGLIAGQSLYSCDGRFRLTVQSDGNLVLYQGGTAIWADNKYGSSVAYPATMAVIGTDGNFRHYTPTAAVWESNTHSAGAALYVQNDGNMVIYSSSGAVLWKTNTCCR